MAENIVSTRLPLPQTIPYGEKFHARKIERLLYSKDLLLNSEWNNKKRDVNLHRHPAFVGSAEDVIHDCCGYCPKPVTPEEQKVWEEESKIYISGEVSFLKDDPGRQSIGSFNPITETDWTGRWSWNSCNWFGSDLLTTKYRNGLCRKHGPPVPSYCRPRS